MTDDTDQAEELEFLRQYLTIPAPLLRELGTAVTPPPQPPLQEEGARLEHLLAEALAAGWFTDTGWAEVAAKRSAAAHKGWAKRRAAAREGS